MSKAKNPSIAVLKRENGAEKIGYGQETVAGALGKRILYRATVAEVEALTEAAGTVVELTEPGRAGRGVIRDGVPPVADTQKGVFIPLAGGKYWERDPGQDLTPQLFGAAGGGALDSAALIGAMEVSNALQRKLWVNDHHVTDQPLPFLSRTHIVGLPWAQITGDFAGPLFLDPKYEAVDGHSYGQVVEHLEVSNTTGDCYHVQPRNMKISYGRISAMNGYGVKISSASDQAFENFFDHVLFKGCKYPIWSRGKSADPVTAEAAYAYDASDSWVTNCIFDGYAGQTVVMQYAYIYGGSGWRFQGNHWYGSLAAQFLEIKGINVAIGDYFERNGTDRAVRLLSGNPASYNLAGSTFWLSPGGKAVKFDQGSYHQVSINLSGATVTGGDTAASVLDVSYFRDGSSALRCAIDVAGLVKPYNVEYANDMLRVYGAKTVKYLEDQSGAPVTWGGQLLHETTVFNKKDEFAANLVIGTEESEIWDKCYRLFNASPVQLLNISTGGTIVRPDGTEGTSYNLAAGASCLLFQAGGKYRIAEA